ncbi:uncharacterized protein E0L32_006879 [Thyridium curvatum]|uniref:DUF7580 domain-containing protein n=1 Tax=Thyridium curvatum TaxID=1093900 RepID=A0A507AY69_9PEZI|nr:uncharacterized protein E0L32_006879 [Thyridium curvatum]TPX12467.1 hypothetical protein E0L32_006879 [Thyridium curvatum]
MEVAGIALGVLPILLRSVDVYKESIRRVGTTIRKRKHIEKLARALLLQQQILEETVKSIILASGCDNVQELDEDPFAFFSDDDVREQVEEYLGSKNSIAFVGLLTANNESVKKVARNISGLVPSELGVTEDLVDIIDANQQKPNLLADLGPRVKLMLGITDMKDIIEEIDEGTAALERFSRLALSNRQTVQSSSSRKAVKLAKALRHIRTFANSLYLGILEAFREDCHDAHATRLYLDDRIDIAPDILSRVGKSDHTAPLMKFDLVFTGVGQKDKVFYETAVQVFGEDDRDDGFSIVIDDDKLAHQQDDRRLASQVTLLVSRSPSPGPKPEIASIADLCATIREANGSKRRISFALLGNQGIGTLFDEGQLRHHQQPLLPDVAGADPIPLSEILRTDSINLSWKFRMLLALRLASSLLQLLQTNWLERAWSKDNVFFLKRPTAAPASGDKPAQVAVDLNRPFVACSFDAHGPTPTPTSVVPGGGGVEPKVALLELGILLLEIWHRTTLERRFGLDESRPPAGYYERMARAVEWLDDVDEPLPDLYDRAVSHCLRANIGGDARFADWEDKKLWHVVCGDIIEPLAKICRQWSG